MDLTDWLKDVSSPSHIWFVKRLSANDTGANHTHQAGTYISKDFLFSILPALNDKKKKNPDAWFDLYTDSHKDVKKKVRVIWYNNRFHENPKGGRNEVRITNFGGKGSPLQNHENTGALVVYAFLLNESGNAINCRVWVCRDVAEEELVENVTGSIDPGEMKAWSSDEAAHPLIFRKKKVKTAKLEETCWLDEHEIPLPWLSSFPSALEIIEHTIKLRPEADLPVDKRLMRRRECEFNIFKSLELAVELPYIKAGFSCIDDFLAKAQTILQRRKARSGRSLELHTKYIFTEEGLVEGKDFSHGPESEKGKRPDFLFPSESHYKNASFSSEKLRMLAVKTTCKDRWRQILNEADRIETKHLLTLQEGVSENQFREMTNAHVKLVVPYGIVTKYPKKIQPYLLSLEGFIKEINECISSK